MMHGPQTIRLTKDSVREALEDYLQKHFQPTVVIAVTNWGAPAYGTIDNGLEIAFEQAKFPDTVTP